MRSLVCQIRGKSFRVKILTQFRWVSAEMRLPNAAGEEATQSRPCILFVSFLGKPQGLSLFNHHKNIKIRHTEYCILIENVNI